MDGLGCGQHRAGIFVTVGYHPENTCVVKNTQENGYADISGGNLSPGQYSQESLTVFPFISVAVVWNVRVNFTGKWL